MLIYFLIKFIDDFNPIFLQERIGKLENKIYIYKFSKFEYSRIFYITVLSFYLDAINSFINKTKVNADEIINLLNDEISKAKQLFDNHSKILKIFF